MVGLLVCINVRCPKKGSQIDEKIVKIKSSLTSSFGVLFRWIFNVKKNSQEKKIPYRSTLLVVREKPLADGSLDHTGHVLGALREGFIWDSHCVCVLCCVALLTV